MRTVRYGLLIAMFLLFYASLYSQTTIIGWEANGVGSYGTSPMTATTIGTGVSNSLGLTRGSGVVTTGTAAGSAWGGTTWSTTDAATGISGNKFATFGFTVNAGYQVSISQLDHHYRRSATGATLELFQYQVNGGTWTDIDTSQLTISASSGMMIIPKNLSGISALQNLVAGTIVNFRIVPYGASSTGTWYVFNTAAYSGDDLKITGTISNTGAADGQGTASITNGGAGALSGLNLFKRNQSGQTVNINLTGVSAGALTDFSVDIPSDWTGLAVGNVSLTGTGFGSASKSVSGNTITVSGASLTDVNTGVISVSGITTPALTTLTDNGNYTFTVKSAKSGGTLTTISSLPKAYVTIPIANIRDQDANGVPLDVTTTVAVEGVATVASNVIATTSLQIFIQDNTGAVNIFRSTAGATVVEGNDYIVKGNVTHFQGLTEVQATADADIHDLGASTPVAYTKVTVAQLLADPESYEGKYIAIQHVSRSSGTWPAAAAASAGVYISVNGGATDSVQLLLNAVVNANTGIAEPTWPNDVRGIFTQSDNSSPYIGTWTTYSITIRSSNDLAVAGTFPVELTSFTATASGRGVELAWKTATEVNNAGFDVEKNVNGVWSKIGSVEGAGNSNAPKSYSYTDAAAKGTISYRLKQIDRDGKFTYSNTVNASVKFTAADYQLTQNFPNPFNPNTSISFAMKNAEHVNVTVYNALGQVVATLFNDVANADQLYTLNFDGRNLSSGTYFYSLRSASRNEVRKMSLMK